MLHDVIIVVIIAVIIVVIIIRPHIVDRCAYDFRCVDSRDCGASGSNVFQKIISVGTESGAC